MHLVFNRLKTKTVFTWLTFRMKHLGQETIHNTDLVKLEELWLQAFYQIKHAHTTSNVLTRAGGKQLTVKTQKQS